MVVYMSSGNTSSGWSVALSPLDHAQARSVGVTAVRYTEVENVEYANVRTKITRHLTDCVVPD